jgi:hypothetical protein
MDRDELRSEIKARRTVIYRGGPFLPCVWRGRQAKNDLEAHEVFFKRSLVVVAQQDLIFVPENCVQLH